MAKAWWGALALAALALVAAGCGGSGRSSPAGTAAVTETQGASAAESEEEEEEEEEEQAATPAEAIEEIGETRELLERALGKLRAGDAANAEELAGDAYLEHFEHVERLLGERDKELMEDLEKTISTTIRKKIKAGASVAEVERLVSSAKQGLARAEKLLESG